MEPRGNPASIRPRVLDVDGQKPHFAGEGWPRAARTYAAHFFELVHKFTLGI